MKQLTAKGMPRIAKTNSAAVTTPSGGPLSPVYSHFLQFEKL